LPNREVPAAHLPPAVFTLHEDLISTPDELKGGELAGLYELVTQFKVEVSEKSSFYMPSTRIVFSKEMLINVAIWALYLDDLLLLEEAIKEIREEPPLAVFELIRDAVARLRLRH
jgi:hypothetical protein